MCEKYFTLSDPAYGDRVVQLVFIGKGYSQSEIEARMQACIQA